MANKLFDAVLKEFGVKNDAAMCRLMGVAQPTVSRMRKGVLSVGPSMILNVHETFGMPIKRIKELLQA